VTQSVLLGAPYGKEAQDKYFAKVAEIALAAADKMVAAKLAEINAALQDDSVEKAINEASVTAIQESFRKGDDNETEVQSISESVPESKQDGNASSVIEGSPNGDGSDSVPAADDTGHVSDASGDGGNAPSAPEPEVTPGA
jgi:hypothetical protein